MAGSGENKWYTVDIQTPLYVFLKTTYFPSTLWACLANGDFFFTHKTTDTMTWKPLTYAITVSSSINHRLYQFQLRQNPPWVFLLSYPELRGLCWHYPRKFTSLLRISSSWHTGGTPLNAASKYVSLSTFATWFQTSLPTFFLCFLSTSTSTLPVKGRASRLHKRRWVPSEPVYKCFTRLGTLKLKLV